MDERLPATVERFLGEHIASVAQLEILMLLRARREEDFRAADVGRELRMDSAWAAAELTALAARGFLCERTSSEASYRFAPRSDDIETGLAAVIEAYGQRRVSVINAIYAKPASNLRGFADAFRLRKD
jgi:hypothetical protein